MAKVTTTLLLDEELKALAKARKISMSGVCNDALAAILSLPTSNEELIIQEHKLKQELAAIQSKRSELKASAKIRTKREVIEGMHADVKELRSLWSKHNDGAISSKEWSGYVAKFCGIWKVDRRVAVDYAEGKKDVIG